MILAALIIPLAQSWRGVQDEAGPGQTPQSFAGCVTLGVGWQEGRAKTLFPGNKHQHCREQKMQKQKMQEH